MTAATTLPVGKPTFANALKLWPRIPREKTYLKIVRILNGVASLTDGVVLLRRSVMTHEGQAVPDGCYDVRLGGELTPTQNPDWMRYPDIELCRPDGINPGSGKPQLKPLCQLTSEFLGFVVPLVQDIRTKYKGTVVMDKDGIRMQQNAAIGIQFPFNLPEPVVVNPFYLEFVLIEMLQYPTVYLLRETREGEADQRSPLIFGLNWANCGLVMPMSQSD